MFFLVLAVCLTLCTIEVAFVTNVLAEFAMCFLIIVTGLGNYLLTRDTCINHAGSAWERWRQSGGLIYAISLSVIVDAIILIIAYGVAQTADIRWEGVIASLIAAPMIAMMSGLAGSYESLKMY